MSAAALFELRQALERRFPDAMPLDRASVPAVSTGVAALDGLLPGGGLPRGRLTAWQPGGGATAVLRAACETALARGERAAWVDAAGVQSADGWRNGPLLVRPAGPHEALASAEELLRSGGFAVVVVMGAGREAGREGVRLSRAAKAGGAALVVATREVAVAHLRAVTRLLPEGCRWRCDPFGEPVDLLAVRVQVEAASLGWSGQVSFELPVRTHRVRLAPDPGLVDRRGAPAQVRWRRTRREASPDCMH